MESLPTIETARRLLRGHGIDDAQLEAAAKEQRRAWERDWDEKNPTDALTPVGQADLWVTGSVKQLQRHWGGRCISCVHWANPTPLSPHDGVCDRLLSSDTDDLVMFFSDATNDPETAPQFGCICWGEIPADDADTLRARAELAMTLGMLPKMPEAS